MAKLFNWAIDSIRQPKIIDARLDAEFSAIAIAAGTTTGNTINIMEIIPPSEHAAILDYTSTTDLSVYLQEAVDAADLAGGGEILLPRGKITHSLTIDANGAKNVRLRGMNGIDFDYAGVRGSVLVYTGGIGTYRGLDFRNSRGCGLIDIVYAYSSATFDGDLVDASWTTFSTGSKFWMRGCTLFQLGTTYSARSLLNRKNAVDVLIEFNRFARCQYGIAGAPAATVTVSIASPGVVTWPNHTLAANDPFTVVSTGATPTGLTVSTTYYAKTILSSSTFTFSATAGGAAINTTGTQSGVHTGSEVQTESIAGSIRNRNDFVFCEKAAIINPGIGNTIADNIFEPTSANAPSGIRTIGSNQFIRCTVADNVFSDASAAGNFAWVDVGICFASAIVRNSMTGAATGTTGVRVGGVNSLSISDNFFEFIDIGITLTAGATGLHVNGNDFNGVVTNIVGMSFADSSCDFTGNTPDLIAAGAVTATNDVVHVFDTSASVWVRMFLLDFMSVITQLAAKTTLVSTDELPLWDSIAGVAKKVTLANLFNSVTVAALGATTANRLFGTNGTGVSGLITLPAAGVTLSAGALALANDLSALEGLGSTGIAARTAADTWAQRTITGTAAEITVTNGDGVTANPTISLPTALTFTGKTITGGTANLVAASVANSQASDTNISVSNTNTSTASSASVIATSNSGQIGMLAANNPNGTGQASFSWTGASAMGFHATNAAGIITFTTNSFTEALRIDASQLITAPKSFHAFSATAIPAGGTAGSGFKVSSTSNFGVFFGSGAPSLSAAKGSLYLRSDGTTTNDRMYVNTNGSTTWTAVTTVA